jgi:hypothetical protein
MSWSLLYLVSSVAVLAAAKAHGHSHNEDVAAFDWNSIEYVYAFGDSYTFVQGTAGYPNYSFVGDYLNLEFTPEELLSNEIIAKNVRFSVSQPKHEFL